MLTYSLEYYLFTTVVCLLLGALKCAYRRFSFKNPSSDTGIPRTGTGGTNPQYGMRTGLASTFYGALSKICLTCISLIRMIYLHPLSALSLMGGCVRAKEMNARSFYWPPRYSLTHSTPAVSNCCCSNGSAPYWSNPPFLFFDIRAIWRSGLSARAPECQKL